MIDYSKMTNEEFDAILEEIIEEKKRLILGAPGAYEALSEYYNNEILDRWAARNPEKAEPEEE